MSTLKYADEGELEPDDAARMIRELTGTYARGGHSSTGDSPHRTTLAPAIKMEATPPGPRGDHESGKNSLLGRFVGNEQDPMVVKEILARGRELLRVFADAQALEMRMDRVRRGNLSGGRGA